jgi:hypothetical protein
MAILANDSKGFNVGMNSGEAAGQTVFHCHVHLIPRRKGDVENPRGGVKGVIPEKQDVLSVGPCEVLLSLSSAIGIARARKRASERIAFSLG